MPPPSSISLSRMSSDEHVPGKFGQELVRELAVGVGFAEAGVVALPHAGTELDARRFAEFIEAGRAGSMEYLGRRNEAGELIRAAAQVPFPWARSIIVCLASYHADAPLSTEAAPRGAGWIARYAWSGRKAAGGNLRPSDYHKVLLRRLNLLESRLRERLRDAGGEAGEEFESRAYVDTGPVVERSIARQAGLGWTGKNTCLIHPKLGSWNFLAVLVTSLELSPEASPLIVPDRCGSCRRCLDACPTQALIEPYRMDATRCISYLTIEHRGEIAENLRSGMGRQVFGCDICQDVCPWNRKAPIFTSEDASEGLEARQELVNPDLEWLADLDFAGFERLFNGSPVRRTGFNGLRRNIAIAMGNAGLARFAPRLRRWAEEPGKTENEPREKTKAAAVREAAEWALQRIDSQHE